MRASVGGGWRSRCRHTYGSRELGGFGTVCVVTLSCVARWRAAVYGDRYSLIRKGTWWADLQCILVDRVKNKLLTSIE